MGFATIAHILARNLPILQSNVGVADRNYKDESHSLDWKVTFGERDLSSLQPAFHVWRSVDKIQAILSTVLH